ncbi:MAG TPA: TerC family protein [Rubricoccaceae bacterium]|jgi:predicted tellurium resistance membrane protein TerC
MLLDWFATHFSWFDDPQAWVALATLTALEIVLGIDNIVFISILAGRLPEAQQARARSVGLALAMFGRIALLLAIGWVMSLTSPLFHLPFGGEEMAEVSGRDLILLLGGLFLVYKSTSEIHNKIEGDDHEAGVKVKAASFASVIVQILLLDLVFSLDSVITAVGMADEVGVMILAVIVAIGIMMVSASSVSAFIQKHPTIKMLALSFLLMIGFVLAAEGFGQEIPKGYIYGAMAFSLFVETLNLRAKKKSGPPVELRGPGPGIGSGIPAPGFPNA